MAGPDQNPAGRHPAFRQMPGGFLPPDVLQGPPPPPPPPGMGGEWGGPPRPTSGNATISLTCGVISALLALFCPVVAIASIVGLIFGIIALYETGRNGSRSGRGLAIAGLATSLLGIMAVVAYFALMNAWMTSMNDLDDQRLRVEADKKLELIGTRLQTYYTTNGNSLGEGGPVLAQPANAASLKASIATMPAGSNEAQPGTTAQPRVTGTLQLQHLVADDELSQPAYIRFELNITSRNSASIRVWRGSTLLREAVMQDAATGAWMPTGP